MSSNPFICKDGGYPIQSTVCNVEQSLSIFQNALRFDTTGDSKAVSFDFDECCAFQCVLEGLRNALRTVVEELDGYEKKEVSPTD